MPKKKTGQRKKAERQKARQKEINAKKVGTYLPYLRFVRPSKKYLLNNGLKEADFSPYKTLHRSTRCVQKQMRLVLY